MTDASSQAAKDYEESQRESLKRLPGIAAQLTDKPLRTIEAVDDPPLVSVEVTNPRHYSGQDGFIEPIDPIRSVGFNLGSAYKYIARLGLKGGENTEERDTKAAVWYGFDLAAMLLTMEDGDLVPSVLDYAEFDMDDYVTQVIKYMEEYEAETGLRYHRHYYKRFVLGALHMCMSVNEKYGRSGLSEANYRKFVLDVLATTVLTAHIPVTRLPVAKRGRHDAPPPIKLTIYKGSKSFAFEDNQREVVQACLEMFLKLGLMKAGGQQTWGDTSEDEDEED